MRQKSIPGDVREPCPRHSAGDARPPKHHAAEEKIRIVLDGRRGETSVAEAVPCIRGSAAVVPALPS